MIYLTGDTHGDVKRFLMLWKQFNMTAQDTLVVAGDFGCIFGQEPNDDKRLDLLAQVPFTILFLDGNHECFPKIYAYPVEQWHGGKVHRIRPNILHLMRGQVFDLEGTSVFTMGGGYSIDRVYRTEGVNWWPQELPTDAEYDEAWENLRRHNNRVDVIISHAAPEGTMEMFIRSGLFHNRFPEEMPLNAFLEAVRQKVHHERYYFGHLHLDMPLFKNQTALYFNVYDLKTGQKLG